MPEINLFPLNSILLPDSLLPLQIFEPRYLKLLKDCILDEPIGIIQPNSDDQHEPPVLHQMGCSGRVVRMEELDTDRYFVLLRGEKRFHYIGDTVTERGYRRADIRWVLETSPADENRQYIQDREQFLFNLRQYLENIGVKADLSEVEDTRDVQLINSLSMMMPLNEQERQNLLEAMSVPERLHILEQIIGLTSSDAGNTPFRH